MPRVDGLTLNNSGEKVSDLMVGLATFTNANFYSSDTIADTALGIKPNNWEIPYASPQMSTMTKKVYNRHFTWFRTFESKEIPIVLSNMGIFYDTYEITPNLALKQAEVQLPLAVSAGAKTINDFLPTLKLTQRITEEKPDSDILSEALKKGAEELKQFSFASTLTHEVTEDNQWQEFGLTIRYSGPGELLLTRGGKQKKICDLSFTNGEAVAYKDPTAGEWVDETPVFVGSNKDYIEGSEDLSAVRMEMDKGKIMFRGFGVNENGNTVETPFLTGGSMVGPGAIEGSFNFPGTLSGTWRADKK